MPIPTKIKPITKYINATGLETTNSKILVAISKNQVNTAVPTEVIDSTLVVTFSILYTLPFHIFVSLVTKQRVSLNSLFYITIINLLKSQLRSRHKATTLFIPFLH